MTTSYKSLEKELSQKISGEVRFDATSRALYSTDASNYRQIPIGITCPKTIEDVYALLEISRRHGIPILSRGGGTSIAGQCCNVALVMDWSKYLNRVLEINREEKMARVQPGVVLDQLQAEAGQYGLMFGPDPATHSRCTLGGMIGNNSCGVHSVMAGKTSEQVLALDVLTYRGNSLQLGAYSEAQAKDIIAQKKELSELLLQLQSLRDKYADLIRQRFPKLSRRVSGYNLDALLPENGFDVAKSLVGTEGTCVTLLEAKVKLLDKPREQVLLVLGYPDIFSAADDAPMILKSKPIGFEGLDDHFVNNLRKKGGYQDRLDHLPAGNAWLFIEFGAVKLEEARAAAEKLLQEIKSNRNSVSAHLYWDIKEKALLWSIRETAVGATTFVPGQRNTFSGWEDSAVPPEKLGAYLRELRQLMDDYHYEGVFYGHFGEGCIHARISFDLESQAGIKQYKDFVEQASDLVLKYEGSLSGEHGDGQTRAHLLEKMFGPELMQAFQDFKTLWDPDHKMNPGKIVNAYPVDQDLKSAAQNKTMTQDLGFIYPVDGGDFNHAVNRCIGVGKCRQDTGAMCPSFQATGEEMHSTRGRAHLLYEMLQGEVLTSGWQERGIKEALDLCLSCKACKKECPTQVDMASYKAEFLSHYHKTVPHTLLEKVFSHIHNHVQLASISPSLFNFLTHAPGISSMVKSVLGISQRRFLPKMASKNFQRSFSSRSSKGNAQKGKVVLWPDTFTNYFQPQVAESAVFVLEHLGYEVQVPQAKVCCGRPLYDFGYLGEAKKTLQNAMEVLEPFVAESANVLFLEPSCLSVFRDEMMQFYPESDRGAKLANKLLSWNEFLQEKATDLQVDPCSVKMHGHCHQKALWGMEAEETFMKRLGVNFEVLDTGCCGMAGAFGYHQDEISEKIAKHSLSPALQGVGDAALVVDGFSCRSQVQFLSNSTPLHSAEWLAQRLRS